ncbi:YraN family protein [Gorillibacterium timonense]|uniref:YraN family protein n=1 Tax=Gorillibacterium timonense TaxID=1689269 RepID=UPI000AC09033|nr:YraN family protein [Gorillibacterium timonense]
MKQDRSSEKPQTLRIDGRRLTGKAGEEAAAQYLLEQGHLIRERNWRCRSGELDIVAEEEGCLVIVEVRTRKPSVRFGTPQESVDARKQLQVRRTAEVYLYQHRLTECRIRFDLISIRLNADGSMQALEHLRHAF